MKMPVRWRAILMSMLLIGCARGPDDIITMRIGMGAEEFNSQPFTNGGYFKIGKEGGMAGSDEPVLLKLDINEKLVEFESGGSRAFIIISSSNAPTYKGEAKITGVSFGANDDFLDLDDAMKLAKSKCDEARQAGLRVNSFLGETATKIPLKKEPFEIIANSESDYKSIVWDEKYNIVQAPICELTDGKVELSLWLENRRRDLENVHHTNSTKGLDIVAEKAYLVRGYLHEVVELPANTG